MFQTKECVFLSINLYEIFAIHYNYDIFTSTIINSLNVIVMFRDRISDFSRGSKLANTTFDFAKQKSVFNSFECLKNQVSGL